MGFCTAENAHLPSPQQGIERKAAGHSVSAAVHVPQAGHSGHLPLRFTGQLHTPGSPPGLCACQPSGMASSSRAIPPPLPLVIGRPMEEPSSSGLGDPQRLGRQGWSPMPAAYPCPQIPSVDCNENNPMRGSSYVCRELALPSKRCHRDAQHWYQTKPQGEHHTVAWTRGRHSAAACLSPVSPGLDTRAVAVVGGGRGKEEASSHYHADSTCFISLSG